jgi:hypothetical protein
MQVASAIVQCMINCTARLDWNACFVNERNRRHACGVIAPLVGIQCFFFAESNGFAAKAGIQCLARQHLFQYTRFKQEFRNLLLRNVKRGPGNKCSIYLF